MTNTKQLNNSLIRLLSTALDTLNDVRNDNDGTFVLARFDDEYEVQYSPYDIEAALVTTLTLRTNADFLQAIEDVTAAIAEAL